MIIGNPDIFALESGIMEAYENPSMLALGYYVIHVGGLRYGFNNPDATMMGTAYGDVEERIAHRGKHQAPFAEMVDAGRIADSYRQAIYAEEQSESYLGMPLVRFRTLLYSHEIVWVPDGEEGFDDDSNVLQFDVGNRVRIIAFKDGNNYVHDATTLKDIWIPGDKFYSILQQWHDAFKAEWESTPKTVCDD